MGSDDLWYKDAVFYELPVKAYSDANADGIGDFPALMGRLDHLQDLGADCIWVLPMYPSPFRDDGYDISDYLRHPSQLRQPRRLPSLSGHRPRPRAECHHRARG
jgi:hypothetical protein